MRFYVAVTNNSWYDYLSAIQPDEVNFWKPGGQPFKAIQPGDLFLFKLHAPRNFIAGGGYFVRYEVLPLSLAWDAFGEKNGAENLADLRKLILPLVPGNHFNPQIGCAILNEPFFFPRESWILPPPDFAPNIVAGKTYDTTSNTGRNLWGAVLERLVLDTTDRIREMIPEYEVENRHGKEYLQRARLGQGAFRVLVTGAYQRRCAISGERTLPVLEAAHIKPFAESGPNRINNGLLLRSDMHKLFDAGYLTVTPDYHVEVSRRIKEEFENGLIYYPYHGRKLLVLPDSNMEKPGKDYLEWHNREVYRR